MSDHDLNQDDLPLDVSPVDSEMPMEDIQQPTSQSVYNRGTSLGHAAILKSYNDQSSILEAFEGLPVNEGDTKKLVQVLAQEKSIEDQKDLTEMFSEDPGVSPLEMRANAEVINEMLAEESIKGSQPELQVVDAISTPETDAKIAASIEADMILTNELDAAVENYEWYDIIYDIVREAIPGFTLKDNFTSTGSIINAEAYLQQVVLHMKDVKRNDPERFTKILPGFTEALKGSLPEGKAISVLSALATAGGEESSLFEFSNIFAALSITEVALVGKTLAMTSVSLSRKINAIRTASRLGNKKVAADINTVTLVDETGEAAKVTGVEKTTAYNNALPFEVGELDESYTSGLSHAAITRVNELRAKQTAIAKKLQTDELFQKEAVFNKDEVAAAEKVFRQELKDSGFTRVIATQRDSRGTSFSYSYEEGGVRLKDNIRMDLTLDDKTGNWAGNDAAILGNYFRSPTALANNAIEEVNQAIRLDSKSAIVQKSFNVMQNEAVAPILGKHGFRGLTPGRRKELAEVDHVLVALDGTTETLTVQKLRQGVDGVSLNDRQIETVFNLRGLYDNLWWIRDSETRAQLKLSGYRNISTNGTNYTAKPFSKEGAQVFINKEGSIRAWDVEAGKSVRISGKDVNKLYEKGIVISRSKENLSVSKGGADHFDILVSKSHKIGDLPISVTKFKPNYVPKFNKDAYYFVKSFKETTVNGKAVGKQPVETVRFFKTKKEANDWVKTQDVEDGSDLRVLADRELESEVMGSSNLGSSGGMYSGARSTKDIPFGPEGLPAERLGAFEALTKNVRSLENFVSRNEWRMGLRKKWINTAKAEGFDIDGFDPHLLPSGSVEGKRLQRLASQIDEWSGFPSEAELAWDTKVASTIEWAMNANKVPGNKLIASGLHHLRHTDPLNYAMAATFHSMLGALNPVQLWVQAQGSSIALTLATKVSDPLGGIMALRSQTALQLASHTNDVKIIAHIAKGSGIPKKDLLELKDLWDKSGFQDSIKNTADNAASAAGYGITANALKKAADSGLLFYRAGELFNRRTSFSVAWREFKRANPGKAIGKDELNGIMTRANNFMLNLSKSNKAGFQRGAAKLGTQFWQVQAKTIESILGLNQSFSRTERVKILMGQMALYGSSGVPLAGLGIRTAASYAGVTQADVENNPLMFKAATQGFWGSMVMWAFDADVDLSKRGAILSSIEESAYNVMFGDASVGELFAGAGGQLPLRFFRNYNRLTPMAGGLLYGEGKVTTGELVAGSVKALSFLSSLSQVEKWYYMRNMHMIIDNNGSVVSQRDFTTAEEIATLIGFKHSDVGLTYDLTTLNKAKTSYRNKVVSQLLNNFHTYTLLYDAADSDSEREQLIINHKEANSYLIRTVQNPDDADKITKALEDKILNGKTKVETAIRAYIENFSQENLLEIGEIGAGLKVPGLVRLGLPTDTDEE